MTATKTTTTIKINVPEEHIRDIVIHLADSGVGAYWGVFGAGQAWDYETILSGAGIDVRPSDPDDDSFVVARLDRAALLRGIAVVCEKFQHHAAGALGLADHVDWWTVDAIVQCSLFGDIVYG
jgi:hypothetical protein